MDTAQTPVGYQPPDGTAQPTQGFVPPGQTAAPAPQPPVTNVAPAPAPQPTAAPPVPFAPGGPAAPAPVTGGYVPVTQTTAPVVAPPAQVGGFTPGSLPAQYHSNVETSGFDDDVKTGEYESYSGQKGRTDRLGFLTPRSITWGRTHYISEKGYFICDSKFEKRGGQEVPVHVASCCQKLGPPKKRFSALVCHYATAANGTLLQPFSYVLKVWRFNEQVFDQIRTINREFPLEQCDIFATCTDETYKKFNIVPLRESYVHDQGFRAAASPDGSGLTNGAIVDGYIASMKPRLERTVGTANDAAKWAELLGVPAGMPPFGGPVPGIAGTVVPGGDRAIDSVAQLLRASAPPQG